MQYNQKYEVLFSVLIHKHVIVKTNKQAIVFSLKTIVENILI